MKYTINQAKEEVKRGIRGYLRKDKKGDYICPKINRIPFYLEGKPGIGKTEIVRQIAEELGIGFASFSITHHTRNSLLGLPVISDLECGKYTEYTMSEIIATPMAMAEKGQEEGILLLDEFNCASETIMPTMLAFLQTRNIGKYELPEGWCIVLCGNPKEYNKSARTFDAVILDRVRRLEVDYEMADFLKYAKEKGIHKCILDFLSGNQRCFYRCGSEGNKLNVVTCRGWENLSRTMCAYEEMGEKISEEMIYQFIKSEEVAYAFFNFYRLSQGGLDMEEVSQILQGVDMGKHIKKASDMSFDSQWNLVEVLSNSLETCVYRGQKNEVVSKKITNVLRFLSCLPDAGVLVDKCFHFINSTETLLDVLCEVKNVLYLKLCRKEYALLKEVAESEV